MLAAIYLKLKCANVNGRDQVTWRVIKSSVELTTPICVTVEINNQLTFH